MNDNVCVRVLINIFSMCGLNRLSNRLSINYFVITLKILVAKSTFETT